MLISPFVFPIDSPGWKCPYCKRRYRFARTHVFKKHYVEVTMKEMREEVKEKLKTEGWEITKPTCSTIVDNPEHHISLAHCPGCADHCRACCDIEECECCGGQGRYEHN